MFRHSSHSPLDRNLFVLPKPPSLQVHQSLPRTLLYLGCESIHEPDDSADDILLVHVRSVQEVYQQSCVQEGERELVESAGVPDHRLHHHLLHRLPHLHHRCVQGAVQGQGVPNSLEENLEIRSEMMCLVYL